MTQLCPAPILGVTEHSAASRCGLAAGDVLLTMNGMPLRDTIDVRIYGGESELEILFERGGERRRCAIVRRYGEPLGLTFSKDLFCDDLHLCRNRCEFCFVAQMSPDLRPSLYLRDDDYRLSFLHGNYITLTNFSEATWERIEAQYLSPLYISVHATEPQLRADLLKNPRAGQIVQQLHKLAELGIEMHTQAVLVPGRNDGSHLDQTIADLAALYPAVQDLSVVPVGLTRWHAPRLRTYTDAESASVLDQLLDWQERLRAELGVGFVYPSDEWFLRAGHEAPSVAAYDGLLPAMIENGVGMVRRFQEQLESLHTAARPLGQHQTWVTGTLFAPTLNAAALALEEEARLTIDVVPVPNQFLGETVTVAGLLTGADIVATLQQQSDLGAAIVIPEEVFRGPEGRSLDNMTAEELSMEIGVPVYVAALGEEGWEVYRTL